MTDDSDRSILGRPPPPVPASTQKEDVSRRLDCEMADAYLAGHLVLLGAAEGALATGRRLAGLRLRALVAAVDELEEEVRSQGGDDLDFSIVSIARAVLASEADFLVELLAPQVDWRVRALKAEADLEQSEYSLATLRAEVRDAVSAVGEPGRELRYVLETLRGAVLAAGVRERECAALAVSALECLARVPTADMPSDLEAQAHAVLASPRSRDTEAVAAALLDRVVDERAADRLRGLHDRVRELVEHRARLRRTIDERDERLAAFQIGVDEAGETIQEARVYVADVQREVLGLRRTLRWGLPTALVLGAAAGYLL